MHLQVIYNLRICRLEVRAEDDAALQAYRNERLMEVVKCPHGAFHGTQAVRRMLNALLVPSLQRLDTHGILQSAEIDRLNLFVVGEAER